MNRPQTDPERKCRVAKDYQAEFPDPIAVEAGEAFIKKQCLRERVLRAADLAFQKQMREAHARRPV